MAALAAPSAAQAQSAIEFFPRTVFFMDAEHLGDDDIRFRWAANFFGEVDVFGWSRGGRATFLANYEVVLGDQLRRFDPNQGNYTLEGSLAQEIGGIEVAGEFHHVSRHLSDRPKIAAVDWNMVGLRVRKALVHGDWDIDARAAFRGTIANSLVDYSREVESLVRVKYALKPRVGIVSNTRLRVIGVDGTRNRGTQTGVRTEGGVRLAGTGGALELFVAAERRVDPYPTQFFVERWVTAGFRLMSN
jgi:hypothetical protein